MGAAHCKPVCTTACDGGDKCGYPADDSIGPLTPRPRACSAAISTTASAERDPYQNYYCFLNLAKLGGAESLPIAFCCGARSAGCRALRGAEGEVGGVISLMEPPGVKRSSKEFGKEPTSPKPGGDSSSVLRMG